MAFESTWLNEPYILLTEYTGHGWVPNCTFT